MSQFHRVQAFKNNLLLIINTDHVHVIIYCDLPLLSIIVTNQHLKFNIKIVLTQICNLTCQNGRKRVQLINKHQISQWPWCKKESVTLFQGHSRTEFRFIIIITKMCNLIQIAVTNEGCYKKLDTSSAVHHISSTCWRNY
jgi:hypothetical protein